MSKRKITQIVSLMLVLVMLAMTLVGCAQKPATTTPSGGNTAVKTVKIGCLYGLTGNNASVSAQYVGSLKTAIDIVNNAHPELGDFPFAKTEGLPGLNGAKIELVTADTQSNPEVGATECERLITQEKVDAIIGGHTSAVAKTASVAAEKLRTPYLTGSASSPSLTERGLEYFFRPSPSDATYAEDAFKFLDAYKDKVGFKTVAIAAEEAEYGKLNQQLWTAAAKAHGYQVVESFTYPSNPASVTAECIKIKQANPDVLFMATQTSETILYTKAFKEMDINPKVIMTARGGFIQKEWFDAVGKDSNYIVTANAWCLDFVKVKPFTAEINKIMQKYAGTDINGDYAREMDTFFVLMDAINRAGSVDKEKVKTALLATDIKGDWLLCPWAGVKFDPKTHSNIYTSGVITQVQDQKYVSVFPDAVKTVEPILPMPKWGERK